jgi:hypothetical protein
MFDCTVAGGVSSDVKVQGGAMSDFTVAGRVSADVKVQGGANYSGLGSYCGCKGTGWGYVQWLGELVWM